ncbi:hypothetical protein APSETT444_007881 [Aspergillus pseudonomiae]
MAMDEFLLHAVTFGMAVYLIATRTLKIIPRQIPDPVTRKNIQSVALFGCGKPFSQRNVWATVDPFQRALSSVTWWHVFTAIGGYIAVAIIDLLTSGEVDKDSTERLAWPLPVVARLVAARSSSTPKKGN